MARSRYRFLPDDPVPYFVTVTTVKWIPHFRSPELLTILVDSLRFLINSNRLQLYAYVIMEDHLHLICSGENPSKEISNFKSFTARKCINYLLTNQQETVLSMLEAYKKKFKPDRSYQLWQEGSHPQRIENEAMFQQKVDYIHLNPVRRGYVDLPEDWLYSSARDYMGMEGLLPLAVLL